MATDREISEYVSRFTRTRDLATRAVMENPRDVKALFGAGVAFRLTGDFHSALKHFREAARILPGSHLIHFEMASLHEFLGEFDDAARCYRTVLKIAPDYYKATYALVALESQTRDSQRVDALERQFSLPDPDGWRQLHIGHALAKTYEDLDDIEQMMSWLERAKQRRRQMHAYNVESDMHLTRAIRSTASRLSGRGNGHPAGEPIFVVGLPRTGTTLVERILCSHPDVCSAGEIGNFAQLYKKLSGSTSVATVDADTVSSTDLDFGRLGRLYVESTRPLTGHTPRFVDKAPSNYLLSAHILAALPNARIICLRKSPLDAVLSNYKQIFPLDDRYYDYVYELEATAQRYVSFDALVTHWKSSLPGNRFLELRYDDLVADQETQIRALVAFCGLAWDERCLQFHRNVGGVATPSTSQVRKAIYGTAVGRWRKFSKYLGHAAAVLEQAGIV